MEIRRKEIYVNRVIYSYNQIVTYKRKGMISLKN